MKNVAPLFEALEAALKGSRSLDARIQIAIGGVPTLEPPPYTTSLDAALTLVPPSVLWVSMCDMHEGERGAHVWLEGPSIPDVSDIRLWGQAHLRGSDCMKLRPLAVCVAALTARVLSS